MRGEWFLVELARQPWAILESMRPTVERVLGRVIRGEPMTLEDEDDVEEGQRRWELRTGRASARAGDVAIVGIYGVMLQRGGMTDLSTPAASTSAIAAQIQGLAADGSVGSIVLDIDSPGGSVYGVQELADAIFQARESKPVVAVANSLAASAAYYAGSQASEFYCAPGAEVGSIGVYTMHVDYSGMLEKDGIKTEIIKAGKYKVEGNPYGPLDDDARTAIQGSVDQYYDAFVRSVARGRGVSLKSVRDGMGQGRVLQSDAAKAENMIDGVATLSQVISRMQARGKRAGASSALALAEREIEIANLG